MEDLRTDLDAVATKFASYLEHYPAKTRSSAHGVLGPVRKAVTLSLKPLMTTGQVEGKAARMHEMAQGGRPLSSPASQALENAVSSLFQLVQKCPVHLRKPVTDRLLDHVYLLRRKAGLRFWGDWVDWLRARYKSIEELNSKCGSNFADFGQVRTKGNARLETDFREFRQAREAAGKTVLDVDDPDQDD
jgi:hypothetical protein